MTHPNPLEARAKANAEATTENLERQLALSIFAQRNDLKFAANWPIQGNWQCCFVNYDGPGSPIGSGNSREAAMIDLFEPLWEGGKL